jgi:hypothetical protein
MNFERISGLLSARFSKLKSNLEGPENDALEAFKVLERAKTLEVLAVFEGSAELDLRKFRGAGVTILRAVSVERNKFLADGPVELDLNELFAVVSKNEDFVNVFTARNELDPRRTFYSTMPDFGREIRWEDIILGDAPKMGMHIWRQTPSGLIFSASDARKVLLAGDRILNDYPVVRTDRVEIIGLGASNGQRRVMENPVQRQTRQALQLAPVLA